MLFSSSESKFIHDIATPITGLAISLELLQLMVSMVQGEESKTILQELDRCGEHVKSLTTLVQARATNIKN